jgi:putative transposase
MKTQKVIKCKITDLTNIKNQQIGSEYDNLQTFLQLEKEGLDWVSKDIKLHSANKQQALRFYNEIKSDKEYNISIRNDLLKIEFKPNNKVSKYWCKIPNKNNRKLWVAIKPHIKDIDFSEYKIGESKLFKKKNKKNKFEWWVYITIIREVKMKESYSNTLAIDLGSKVIATVCGSFDNQKPTFYGREVRGIRRHYQYLRTELGRKKLLKKIKKLSDKEKRIVNNLLHKISKQIVEEAEKTNSYIVLGDLKNIRRSAKGKRFNRIVSNMPYLKLTKYIEYKANGEGIKVIKIDETGTSKTCSKCGYEDKRNRKTQGYFKCKKCEFEINADVNGVRNILKFSEGYTSSERASVNMPQTLRCKT